MYRNIVKGIPFVFIAILAALAGVAAVSAGALPGGLSAAVPGTQGKPTGDAPMLATGSGFTYQGRLSSGSGPANGQYDLVFTLFDAASGSNQIGNPVTMTNQTVTGGLFNVTLDFGPGAFNGSDRWLEVAVRPSGTGSFATLTPRQQLTAAPYALGLAPGAGVTGTLAGPMLTLSNTVGAGLYSQSTSNNGVTGIAASSGTSGVYGENYSQGYGIAARNNSTSPLVAAVYGQNVVTGTGVFGTGGAYGVIGIASLSNSVGVYGSASGTGSVGLYGVSTAGKGVYAYSDTGNGVYAYSGSNVAVYAVTSSTFASNIGAVYGTNTGGGPGVRGASTSGHGVYGQTNNIYYAGVYGLNTSGRGYGLYASGGTIDGVGVYGTAGSLGGQFYGTNGTGVYANGTTNGIEGHSNNGVASGVYGDNFGGGFGVAARASVTGTAFFADNPNGLAGNFRGNVMVQGNLSKGGGSFKIDHPLDPTNKYLYHSFVESPDMMNIYNGNVTLDANGEATVKMPDWFDALNKEFRYQLTTIGAFAPVYIAQEITGDSFKIAGGKPGTKVSWQVTGIRHDAYAEAHRIPVEENKAPEDRGKYLYPDAYGKPENMGIGYTESQELANNQVKVTLEHGR